MIRTLSAGVLALLALNAATLPSRAQAPSPTAPTAPVTAAKLTTPRSGGLDAKMRQRVFDIVWGRVNERYYDPAFGGVDWKAVRKRYAPLALNAAGDEAFYGVLGKMLGELKRSHFAIVPPDAYTAADLKKAVTEDEDKGATSTRAGTAGLTVQLIGEEVVITAVAPNSGAAAAGLRPGYVLTHIREKPIADLVEKMKAGTHDLQGLKTMVRLGVGPVLAGPEGSELVLGYRDADDKTGTVTLKRTAVTGTPSKFGELPTIYVENEQSRLEGGIGYIRFNIFLMPILAQVTAMVQEMRQAGAPAIILDLRGNPGGIGVLAPAVARSFFGKQTNLGVMKLRDGEFRFPVYPVEKPYKGPLVILTDEGSASTSEILAGSLQELGRAVVIGSTTAGQVMPSIIERLPGGARLQYAFADCKTPKGKLLEGKGVTPDIPVVLTRQMLLASPDPVLDAAVTYLKKKFGEK